MTATPGPWVVVSAYPAWPSPYFAELQRHAPPALRLRFAADLDTVADVPGPPGVVNVHRLKRLYRGTDGRRTRAAAEAMLDRLAGLRARGWRVVWTVHNLLPIDGGTPGDADRHAAYGTLTLADAVITHTRADAVHLGTLTSAPVTVAGWAGLTAPDRHTPVPADIAALAAQLATAPRSMLILGNLTAYKGLPEAVAAFAQHTRTARLFLTGPCPDPGLAVDLEAAADRAGDRVQVRIGRVDPGHVHALYRAADVAWCPYRSDGPWEFFTRVLHPSSVGTAVAFGTPVLAPDLPAVAEITTGHPRWLYPHHGDPGPVLAAAEIAPLCSAARVPGDAAGRWRALTDAYLRLAERLSCAGPSEPDAGDKVAVPSPPVVTKGHVVPENPADASTAPIAAVLASHYALPPLQLERLPAGQGTINYRAGNGTTTVFVKRYPTGLDLQAEAEAIGLTRLAGKHGVPVATVVPSAEGHDITQDGPVAISVWEWVRGDTATTGWTPAQLAAAGDALGTIHRAFADHPASRLPSSGAAAWRAPDLTKLHATIDTLERAIADRPTEDAFDTLAKTTLAERRAALHRTPHLLTGLPEQLSTQVLHGDYSAVNLMFDGDQLAAVLDFRPPDPFLVAFELGRIAFDPRTVVLDDEWITAAATLIGEYLHARPDTGPDDVRACGRVALIQLLTSLYGVKQHYLAPGLLQDDLDAFWLLRHRAAARLLDRLDDVEAMLADAVHRGSTGH